MQPGYITGGAAGILAAGGATAGPAGTAAGTGTGEGSGLAFVSGGGGGGGAGTDDWLHLDVAPHVRVMADSEGLGRASSWCPGREEAAAEEQEATAAAAGPAAAAVGASTPGWRTARLPRAVDLVGVDGAVFGGRSGGSGSPSGSGSGWIGGRAYTRPLLGSSYALSVG